MLDVETRDERRETRDGIQGGLQSPRSGFGNLGREESRMAFDVRKDQWRIKKGIVGVDGLIQQMATYHSDANAIEDASGVLENVTTWSWQLEGEIVYSPEFGKEDVRSHWHDSDKIESSINEGSKVLYDRFTNEENGFIGVHILPPEPDGSYREGRMLLLEVDPLLDIRTREGRWHAIRLLDNKGLINSFNLASLLSGRNYTEADADRVRREPMVWIGQNINQLKSRLDDIEPDYRLVWEGVFSGMSAREFLLKRSRLRDEGSKLHTEIIQSSGLSFGDSVMMGAGVELSMSRVGYSGIESVSPCGFSNQGLMAREQVIGSRLTGFLQEKWEWISGSIKQLSMKIEQELKDKGWWWKKIGEKPLFQLSKSGLVEKFIKNCPNCGFINTYVELGSRCPGGKNCSVPVGVFECA